MDNRKYLPIILIGIVGLIAIIAFSNSTFLTIEAGEAGVIFKKFGGGLEKDRYTTRAFM